MKSAIISLLFLTKQSLSSGGSWDYDHMTHWADTYSMCNNQDESPIDIDTNDLIHDDTVCAAEFEWDVDFTKQTFKVINNGHTVVLRPAEAVVGSIDLDGDLEGDFTDEDGGEYFALTLNENTIATFPNYFKPDDSIHDSFCLDSLHFHWGTNDWTGSEHLVDGVQYPLEVHFVHYSCAHTSLGATLAHFPDEENVTHKVEAGEDTHQLGVVGIFFDVVNESNPAFDTMFESLEEFVFPNTEKGELDVIVKDLDLSEIIPEDVNTAGYYAYEGSLTTPPCTDIVRWHVMKAHGTIGADQMEYFRTLLLAVGHQIAPNYRVVQENVNDVYACGWDADVVEVVDDSTARAVVWVVAVISMLTPVFMGIICVYQNKKEAQSANANVKTLKQ